MKRTSTFFVLLLLISLASCDTMMHYTVRVAVDRNPTLTIENQTGHQVVISAPLSLNINNGARTQIQPTETNRSIDVTYRIGQIQFTEQVTMSNADTTVILTKRPPTITVENQTGYQVTITAPLSTNVDNRASTQFLSAELNQTIDVTYRIGQIQFTEQVTVNNADATITLTRRPPTITVVNQTNEMEHPVEVISPSSSSIAHGQSTNFLVPANQTIDITYRIGRMRFTERITMRNEDVTVTLNRKPPYINLVNNVGTTINNVFIRTVGTPNWVGGNIVIRNNRVQLGAAGGAQIGDISGSVINGDSVRIWMGDLELSADSHSTGYRFDVRTDDVQGNTYVKGDTQILNDITLTFTRSDRP